MRPALEGSGLVGGYAALGERLGMSESAVKVAAHRMRARYREMLRREVADTVGLEEGNDAIADEIRHLIESVSR